MKNRMYYRKILDHNTIQPNTEYLAAYAGKRFFGTFQKTTYDGGWNFVSFGSIFPMGIPFMSLDTVWQEVDYI